MTQTWNPEQYARNARFVSDLGAPVLELLDPQPGERILDLGCGDGVLTAKLQSIGCDVLGVDASAAQVEATKKLGVPAQTIDGENLPFENEFDAVFSNAALHWMRNNPDAVIAGVHKSPRPGEPRRRHGRRTWGGKNKDGPHRRPQPPQYRRQIRRPLVLPHCRRLFRPPHSRWLHHRLHRVNPAPHSTPRRRNRMAPGFRPKFHRQTSTIRARRLPGRSAGNSPPPTLRRKRKMDRRLHPPQVQSDKVQLVQLSLQKKKNAQRTNFHFSFSIFHFLYAELPKM